MKRMTNICCIYKISCLINNKIYIGQTINFINRKRSHICALKHNRADNRLLQKDYNLYGLNNFKFEIIEECKKEDLLCRETYWIKYYGGKYNNNLYNLKDLNGCSRDLIDYFKQIHKSRPVTSETKQKLRILNLGKNNPMYGKKQTMESNLKRSKALKNRIFSEEHKRKLKETNKRRGYRKYNEDFILNLRSKYIELQSYTKTAYYFNINIDICSNLIKYGTTQRPKN